MKKVVIVCFLGFVLLGGFYFVSHGEKAILQKKTEDVQKDKISGDNYIKTNKDDVELKSVWEKIALSKYGGAKFLTMEDAVCDEGIEFRINSVRITKKFDTAWARPYESS